MQSSGNNQSAESVNTNLSGNQQGADKLDLNINFDTSEADSILGGVDVIPSPQQQVQQSEQPQQTQQQQTQFTPEQINTLRQQLQAQPQTPQETQQPEGIVYSDNFINANTKFKEQTGLDFGAAIDEYMKSTVGMPLKETIEVVQSMSEYINQRQQIDVIEQANNELKSEWGQNYQTYIDIARAEYDKLPQETQQQVQFKQSLNNAQGAKLLLAKALQNQGTGTAMARMPVQYNPLNTPSPTSTVTHGQQPQLRLSEILQMTDAQYAANNVDYYLSLGAGKGYIDDVNSPQQMTPLQGVVNGRTIQPSQMMLGY